MRRSIVLISAYLTLAGAVASPSSSSGASSATPPSVPASAVPPTSALGFRPACVKPADHDEADLCEQIRMADAAEGSLFWLKAQFWLGLVGAAGLLLTLYYTAKSARAAADAANANLEAVRLSRRGFVAIKSFTFHRATWFANQEKVEGFYIRPVVSNLGNGPAVITSTIVSTRVIETPQAPTIEWSDTLTPPDQSLFLGPGVDLFGHDIVINLLSLSKIYSGDIRVLYMFKYRYRDMFSKESAFCTESCFELRPMGDPVAVFKDATLSPSQYIQMEARGEYGSAS